MHNVILIGKNVSLFILAPFIALAYIIALPAVGLFYFTKLSTEALQEHVQTPREADSRNKSTAPQSID